VRAARWYATRAPSGERRGALVAGGGLTGNTGNRIGKRGARALAWGLASTRSLRIVGLGDNRLGSAGAAELAEGVRLNRSLHELDLRGSWARVRVHVFAFAWLPRLTGTCALAGNNIGAHGVAALAKALAASRSVHTVWLWGTQADAARRVAGLTSRALREPCRRRGCRRASRRAAHQHDAARARPAGCAAEPVGGCDSPSQASRTWLPHRQQGRRQGRGIAWGGPRRELGASVAVAVQYAKRDVRRCAACWRSLTRTRARPALQRTVSGTKAPSPLRMRSSTTSRCTRWR
jgi:hypothetical protein